MWVYEKKVRNEIQSQFQKYKVSIAEAVKFLLPSKPNNISSRRYLRIKEWTKAFWKMEIFINLISNQSTTSVSSQFFKFNWWRMCKNLTNHEGPFNSFGSNGDCEIKSFLMMQKDMTVVHISMCCLDRVTYVF